MLVLAVMVHMLKYAPMGHSPPRARTGAHFLGTYVGGLTAYFAYLSLGSCVQDGQQGSARCSSAPQLRHAPAGKTGEISVGR